MAITNEQIMAYVDGQLPPDQVPQVEAAIAGSEDYRAIADGHRKIALAVRMAYDDIMRDPIPDRILAEFDRPPPAQVIRPSFGRVASPPIALAASLALAAGLGMALIWQSLHSTGGNAPARIAEPAHHGVAARGTLASALDTMGASKMLQSPAGERITPVATYPQKGGGWCRDYRMTGQGATGFAGIACRDGGSEGWQIVVHMPWTPPAAVANKDIVPGGPAPEAVDAIAEQKQGGTPLTAAEEAALIARGWQQN